MPPERSQATDDDQRVVPFRPRGAHPQRWRWPRRAPEPTAVEGLAKYEGGEEVDNYRHRMMVNVAALLFTVVLSIAGVWLVIQLAEMRKNQDCVLSGRRNCAPIDVKAIDR